MSRINVRSRPRELMVIRSCRDAEVAIDERKLKPTGQLIVRIPEVSLDECLRWERGLNEAFEECGCLLGAQCGFVAFWTGAALACFQFFSRTFAWPSVLREMLILVVLGSVLGKLISLFLAKLRISRIAQEIRRWENPFTVEQSSAIGKDSSRVIH
jgi:hypothetical protein